MKIENKYIEKCLVLSTVHLKESTINHAPFLSSFFEFPFRVEAHEYGMICFICEVTSAEARKGNKHLLSVDMDELVKIWKIARLGGFSLINFDQDGLEMDSLPLLD